MKLMNEEGLLIEKLQKGRGGARRRRHQEGVRGASGEVHAGLQQLGHGQGQRDQGERRDQDAHQGVQRQPAAAVQAHPDAQFHQRDQKPARCASQVRPGHHLRSSGHHRVRQRK